MPASKAPLEFGIFFVSLQPTVVSLDIKSSLWFKAVIKQSPQSPQRKQQASSKWCSSTIRLSGYGPALQFQVEAGPFQLSDLVILLLTLILRSMLMLMLMLT